MNRQKISYYFRKEKWILFIVTVSGILYNLGMIAGPWFEGQLVQRLLYILQGKMQFQDMILLTIYYVGVILLVQLFRYIKRLYVRKFANQVNKNMKLILYGGILQKSKTELEAEGCGSLMTKAISDIDQCSEGMRKFVTEVFDTGVVMLAYMGMLLFYDWKLALLSAIFPPIAYVVAEKLKKVVTKNTAAYKESAGKLNAATLDRVQNAMTYRVYGQEKHQNELYEERLTDYEKKAVKANIWETAMQPLYRVISLMSFGFIIGIGAANVLGKGFCVWNIAAFTTFISCFTKLATKSSKAAKLFNAVQKARVSWKRIQPFMTEDMKEKKVDCPSGELILDKVSFGYQDATNEENNKYIYKDVSLSITQGEMIGITGPVACGKTTFGKMFLEEAEYEGSITLGGRQWKELLLKNGEIVSYMGHNPQIINATIEENILLGEKGDCLPYLEDVCLKEEVEQMPDSIHTIIGNGGVRLSGGQQARIALARALFHKRPILILDDPFSAVDRKTEKLIMQNLKKHTEDSIVMLISHRLSVFPELSQIIWMEDGNVTVSNHTSLMKQNEEYKRLYSLQEGGVVHEE